VLRVRQDRVVLLEVQVAQEQLVPLAPLGQRGLLVVQGQLVLQVLAGLLDLRELTLLDLRDLVVQ